MCMGTDSDRPSTCRDICSLDIDILFMNNVTNFGLLQRKGQKRKRELPRILSLSGVLNMPKTPSVCLYKLLYALSLHEYVCIAIKSRVVKFVIDFAAIKVTNKVFRYAFSLQWNRHCDLALMNPNLPNPFLKAKTVLMLKLKIRLRHT